MTAAGDQNARRVLLIEDSPIDALMIQEALEESGETGEQHFQVSLATSLADGLARLDTEGADAVLLDLNLPDSAGFETFVRTRDAHPATPVVVLTATGDAELASQAVREGAQDFLVKGHVDARLLTRSVRYAIERKQYEREHEQLIREQAARAQAEQALRLTLEAENERRERQRQEVSSLERLAGEAPAAVAARAYGVQPLAEALPDVFADMTAHYASLFDQAIEERSYRVESSLSGKLRRFAEQMGFLEAGPRDVVELHARALRLKVVDASPRKAQAYVDEGRVMLIELLGYLAAYYRERR